MRSLPILAIAAIVALCPATPAQPITFDRLADTSTAIPNGAGNFSGFYLAPAVSGSTVAFSGTSGGAVSGVYAGSIGGGPLSTIADRNTAVPNGAGTFTGFEGDISPVVSGSTMVFRGFDSNGHVGYYSRSIGGGPLAVIADRNTAIPNGTGNFFGMSGASASGSTVVFGAGNINSGQRGIYAGPIGGGPLTRLVDTNTPIPNGVGNFTHSANPLIASVSGSKVAIGWGGILSQQGIYTGPISGGPLTRIADSNSAIPNGSGNFSTFLNLSLSGSTVGFFGVSGSFPYPQQGIYTASIGGGPLTKIADLNTPIPGGVGNFSGFGIFPGSPVGLSVSGSMLAFEGYDSAAQQGIYGGITEGGSLTKYIMAGDTLDGRIVSSLYFGNFGLDGSELTFEAGFTDGTSGIFIGVVGVPEPSSLALAGTALIGVSLKRRRRRPADRCSERNNLMTVAI